MQWPLVRGFPLLRGLQLERVDRLVILLTSTLHDPIAVHSGAIEGPRCVGDARLTIHASDRRVGAVILLCHN